MNAASVGEPRQAPGVGPRRIVKDEDSAHSATRFFEQDRQRRTRPSRVRNRRACGLGACLLRGARVRALLSATPRRPRLPRTGRAGAGSDHRCVRHESARARRRRRAESVRARRRSHVRLLAGDRRGRLAPRPDADGAHHRVRVLPRAGLLHPRRHGRAGICDARRPDRCRDLLRPALSGVHARTGARRRGSRGRAAGGHGG